MRRILLMCGAAMSAAAIVTICVAQTMSRPAPIRTIEPDMKHPGLMVTPLGKQPKCIGRTIPVEGVQLAPGHDCAPLMPTICMVGVKRCSDVFKSAGRLVPL